MNEHKIFLCLKNIAQSKLNGDCLRIVLFIAGSDQQLRLANIEDALHMSKNNVSTYCLKLYKMGILKRYTMVNKSGNSKFIYPLYSMNWDYLRE